MQLKSSLGHATYLITLSPLIELSSVPLDISASDLTCRSRAGQAKKKLESVKFMLPPCQPMTLAWCASHFA